MDADEIWIWSAGAPLALMRADADGGPMETIRLGGDVLSGYAPHAVIRARCWQAAVADKGWALVTCVVAPGFDFAGFELAPPGWHPETA